MRSMKVNSEWIKKIRMQILKIVNFTSVNVVVSRQRMIMNFTPGASYL